MAFLQIINGWFKEPSDQLKVRALKARADLREAGCLDFMGDLIEMFPEIEKTHPVKKIYNVCIARQVDEDITVKLEALAASKLNNSAA